METWHADHPCRCGHPLEAHEHFRPGTECALCNTCSAYRPETAWERLTSALADGARHMRAFLAALRRNDSESGHD